MRIQTRGLCLKRLKSLFMNTINLQLKEVLCIEVEKRQDINDTTFSEITKLISYLEDVPTDYEWLCDTTEKWCRIVPFIWH